MKVKRGVNYLYIVVFWIERYCDGQSTFELGNGYCLSLAKQPPSESEPSEIICHTNTLCSDKYNYVCEIKSYVN